MVDWQKVNYLICTSLFRFFFPHKSQQSYRLLPGFDVHPGDVMIIHLMIYKQKTFFSLYLQIICQIAELQQMTRPCDLHNRYALGRFNALISLFFSVYE